MLKMIVRQPHLKLHPNHVRIRLPPKLRATGKSNPHQLLTTGFTITLSAFCFLTHPPHVSAIEVDRGQLERILTREFETRVHRASDDELLRLLQQLSMPQSLDFPVLKESPSVFQSITKPIKKQEIKPPKEQDNNPVKEQEIERVKEQEIERVKEQEIERVKEQKFDEFEKQGQDLFDNLTFQMQDLKQKKLNFGFDLNRLQKALRYALASGLAISVFLFGLKSVMTQEQDSAETIEEETESISEQQEEDQTSEDQTPTEGVLWRRSGVQTDSIEDQSFEVEWQDASVTAEQDQDGEAESKVEITEDQKQDRDGVQEQEIIESQKQDILEVQKQDQEQDCEKQDPVEDQIKNQEQDSENQDQEQEKDVMISPPLPRPNWKASEILSNVDSNHSATLLPNILRLSKRE